MKRLLKRDDYIIKLQAMIGSDTSRSVCIPTTGNTPKHPKTFCGFLY